MNTLYRVKFNDFVNNEHSVPMLTSWTMNTLYRVKFYDSMNNEHSVPN